MIYSKIYIPTVKDVMQETEALNYRLLHKAGYVRKSAAGTYTLLPLGSKVIHRLKNILESKLEALGCAEIHLPDSVSIEDFYHNIIAGRLSYKELPLGAWHTTNKAVEGIRPRLGLLQAKSWVAVEGFKLLENQNELEIEHLRAVDAFGELLNELNIHFLEVEQLSWGYPGRFDKLLMLPHEKGEDSIVRCKSCGKSLTIDSIACKELEPEAEAVRELKIEYTPQVKTIGDLSEYLKVDAGNIVKTLIYKADDRLYGVLIRGDQDLSEAKLKDFLKCQHLRAANEKEVFEATNAEVGFAGPIGLKAEIICDYEAAIMKNIIVGANKTDYHYINAVMGRDFDIDQKADLRSYTPKDTCPDCGGEFELMKGFLLGKVKKTREFCKDKSECMVIDAHGTNENIHILGFELNLYRILAAVVEGNNDAAGLIMPSCIAPFDIVVMAVHSDNEAQSGMAMQIYNTLKAMNFHILLDDRTDRISVKFKDSELIGIPLRITVGRKINEGMVELKYRTEGMQEVHIDDVVKLLAKNEVQYAKKAE